MVVPNTDCVVVVAEACVVNVEPNTDCVVEDPKTEDGEVGAAVVVAVEPKTGDGVKDDVNTEPAWVVAAAAEPNTD